MKRERAYRRINKINNISCPECGARLNELKITWDYKVHCLNCNHGFSLYRKT